MKNTISILAVVALMASGILTGCNTSSEKVADAKEEVVEAKEDLAIANEEYQADIAKYRLETADRIAANEKSIAEFKARVNVEKKAARADYSKKIAELERKNSDLKSRIDGYNAEGKEKWETFKIEFDRDMDEMGQAFKNLTVKNVKTNK